MKDRTLSILLLSAVLALGCRESIRPDAGVPPSSGAFTHEVGQDGVITTVVDATSQEEWRYLDLDTGAATDAADVAWDLRFRRFFILSNGGASGPGGVLVARVESPSFDELEQAPESGWRSDQPDGGSDDDDENDSAFNDGAEPWYDYDEATHTLTPKDISYVVATTARRFFKVRVLDYYDDAGSPAFMRFRWAEVDAPDAPLPDAGPGASLDAGVAPDAGATDVPPGAITVDATGADWVYLSVADGVVSPTDPTASTEWDLAFRRTDIRTNSGTSGTGVGGAREEPLAESYDALAETSTFGFSVDRVRMGASPGRPETSVSPALDGEDGSAAWYDYDPTTHLVSAGARVYAVRTATGGYAKLRIWAWVDGAFQLSIDSIAPRVDVVEVPVDASGAEWTYVSLRRAREVEVGDASDDLGWDLGFSGARVRTNGGTSGPGMGGAVETTSIAIAELTEAPASGFVADASLSDAMGSYSGNPALASWFDAAPETPRDVVYAVRAADGSNAALQILSYGAGAYVVAVSYAGPGRSTF